MNTLSFTAYPVHSNSQHRKKNMWCGWRTSDRYDGSSPIARSNASKNFSWNFKISRMLLNTSSCVLAEKSSVADAHDQNNTYVSDSLLGQNYPISISSATELLNPGPEFIGSCHSWCACGTRKWNCPEQQGRKRWVKGMLKGTANNEIQQQNVPSTKAPPIWMTDYAKWTLFNVIQQQNVPVSNTHPHLVCQPWAPQIAPQWFLNRGRRLVPCAIFQPQRATVDPHLSARWSPSPAAVARNRSTVWYYGTSTQKRWHSLCKTTYSLVKCVI